MKTIMNEGFLKSAGKLFLYYKNLGEKAMEQLEEKHLFENFNQDSNSIAIIVNHLHGNMLSRWTDFLHSDGEKPWRERDNEFENLLETKEQVMSKWDEGWACLMNALEALQPDDLAKTVHIRNEAHAVYEAILRQTAHYAYHVGQIIFAAKIVKGGDWISLSIPKKADR